MTTRAFAVPPSTETLTMSPRVISEPSWDLMVRGETQRDTDKPRQGVVANALDWYHNGGVGFIGWLDPLSWLIKVELVVEAGQIRAELLDDAFRERRKLCSG